MVNGNVLRKEIVKNLEGIYIYIENKSYYIEGIDIADFIINPVNKCIRILKVDGTLHNLYNVGVEVIFNNQEELPMEEL